jgi:hypothetical protein
MTTGSHPHQPLRVFLSLARERMEMRVVLERQGTGISEFVNQTH